MKRIGLSWLRKVGIIHISFICTRGGICVENFLSDRSLRSFAPRRGATLFEESAFFVVIVASPFFEKLIQSPPLPVLQNFQSMSMGKRNRSLDGGGCSFFGTTQFHVSSRKNFLASSLQGTNAVTYKNIAIILQYFLQPAFIKNHLQLISRLDNATR